MESNLDFALQLLSMWLKERKIQNQSEHTITAYERDVKSFLEFCDLKQIDLRNVEAFELSFDFVFYIFCIF